MSEIDVIVAGLGILISLITTYLPAVAEKFYALPDEKRGLVMLVAVVLVAGAVFGLSCTPLFAFVSCTKEGLFGLIKAILVALATNQLAYLFSPTSPTKLRLESSNK